MSSLPAIEVVDDPEADTLYRGRKGQGEFCSGKEIQGLVRRFQEVDDGDDTGETDVQRYELGVGVASSGWSGGRTMIKMMLFQLTWFRLTKHIGLGFETRNLIFK